MFCRAHPPAPPLPGCRRREPAPAAAKDLPLFYSSYYLKQSCVRRFFRLPQTLEAGLAALAAETPAAALPEVQKALRAAPHNWRLQMLCAELCRILNRRAEFQHIVEQIRLPSPASVLFRVPLSAPAFLRFRCPSPLRSRRTSCCSPRSANSTRLICTVHLPTVRRRFGCIRKTVSPGKKPNAIWRWHRYTASAAYLTLPLPCCAKQKNLAGARHPRQTG